MAHVTLQSMKLRKGQDQVKSQTWSTTICTTGIYVRALLTVTNKRQKPVKYFETTNMLGNLDLNYHKGHDRQPMLMMQPQLRRQTIVKTSLKYPRALQQISEQARKLPLTLVHHKSKTIRIKWPRRREEIAFKLKRTKVTQKKPKSMA